MKYTRKIHKTPRMLVADAYTIGSNQFQSDKAKEKSVYYMTFRRELNKIDPILYDKEDNRILLFGLQRIIDRILYEPFTLQEVEETEEFLRYAKVTTEGLKPYWFPKELFLRIINEFNGRPPIKISAMPEGSVIYPNEPFCQIESLIDGFGELAAWFESKLLQCWAASERGTRDRHMYDKIRNIYKNNFPHLKQEEINFFASILITDFGDRSGMNEMESEDQGMTGLYTFPGTDTFCGAYQAYKNSNNKIGIFSSVYALAHRNIQAYENEGSAYDAIYNIAENGDFISMVNDCYDSKNAVEKYHLPLALKSKKENNNKIVVSRPDSGEADIEITRITDIAIKNSLYKEVTYPLSDKKWIEGTNLHFIEGDGLTDHDILELLQKTIIDKSLVPWTWGLFGQGGGKRNYLKRDNLSAKYALCSMGNDNEGVVKFSDTFGKTTLPGPFKILRNKEALDNKQTIIFQNEIGDNAMVIYYNGLSEEIFEDGMLDSFDTIKERSHQQFDTMPKSLMNNTNHNYPASNAIINERKKLLIKYAPNKNINNY